MEQVPIVFGHLQIAQVVHGPRPWCAMLWITNVARAYFILP